MQPLIHASALIQRLKSSEFARHVGTLAKGSLLAQVIGLAAAPILTRLYDPASYAALALFMAIVSSISPAASGRYDVAVVVSKDEQDSNGLLVLSLLVAGVVTLIMLLALAIGYRHLMVFFKAESLGAWLLLTPLALFLTAIMTSLKYYANRNKGYELISRVMVTQALFNAILSISLGMAGYKTDGLIITSIMGLILGSLILLYSFKNELSLLYRVQRQEVFDLSIRYRQFPLYDATTSLLNSVQQALPVFFLAMYFSEIIVGYYALLARVAIAPMGFISQAVSQVHLRKMAQMVHQNENTSKYLIHLTLILAGTAALPTIIIILYAPSLFGWVFGSQWHVAGELLVILMPAFAVRFVVSTVSVVFASTGNNHIGAAWKIVAFFVTFAMFWVLCDRLLIEDLALAMMITDVVLYALYYYLIWYAVRHPREYGTDKYTEI